MTVPAKRIIRKVRNVTTALAGRPLVICVGKGSRASASSALLRETDLSY